MRHCFNSGRLATLASIVAGRIVGSHDGQRSTLSIDVLNDQVVYFHETAHEELFTTTIDGCLLATLWAILDRSRGIEPDLRSAIKATSKALLTSSRDAQEIVATYYGIKMVDVDIHASAIAKLTQTYRKHFKVARIVIDPTFKSSFLQVRVIKAVGHFAFRSRFALRFLAEPQESWLHLTNEEKPNWRLRRILDHLSQDGGRSLRAAVDATAAEFFVAQAVAPWDLDSDLGWGIDTDAAFRLDLALDACIDSWLRKQLILPTLDADEERDAFDRLKAFAGERGVILTEPAAPAVDAGVDSALSAVQQQFRSDGSARVRARTQAGSVVNNESIEHKLPALRAEALWELDDFSQADQLQVVGMPADQSADWTVICRGAGDTFTNFSLNGEPVHGSRFARAEVIEWLNAMAEPGQHRWRGPIPEVIVIPMGPGRLVGPTSHSLDDEQTPGAVDGRLNDRVALYMVGNWVDAIDIGLRIGRVDVTEIHMQVAGFGSASVPLHIKVARGDAFPGRCVFRIFAEQPSLDMQLLMFDWMANPDFRQFTSAENDMEGGFEIDFVMKAVNGVMALWHRL